LHGQPLLFPVEFVKENGVWKVFGVLRGWEHTLGDEPEAKPSDEKCVI
jgi:hypothetical protein